MKKKLKHFKQRNAILMLLFLLFPILSFGQVITCTGVVMDNETKEPLIGVSIGQKGTTNGAMTDVDGNFTIKVDEGTLLTFNYIGYDIQDIAAKSKMTVFLKSAMTSLDEVVVVGYGVQKKSVVTAAISSVKADELGKSSPSRVDNILRGQVSGVSITQQSGQPGDGSSVRIRGIGTINNSDPLYIVDGMPIESGIDFLNPADIESVEVLKDAASAAIYGTRGANGVILLTTKQGKSGKSVINYNFSYGWQRPWRHREVLNGEQYMELINEMNSGSAFAPGTVNHNTDWQKEIFNNDAPIVSHQVSLSGGTEKGNYFLSFGYFSQDGIVGGNYNRSNYDRYTVRSNNNYILFDDKKERDFLNKLEVGVNMSYSRIKSTGLVTNSESGGILNTALMAPPIAPAIATVADQIMYANNDVYNNGVKDKHGNYLYIFETAPVSETVNPLATLNIKGVQKNEDKFIASFWAQLDVFKGLKFKTSYGADYNFWGRDYSQGEYYISRTDKLDTPRVYSEMNRDMTWQVENTLTYNTSFLDTHNLTVLLGQSAKAYKRRYLYGETDNLLDASLPNIDASLTPETARTARGRRYPNHTLASYFARLSYNFDERYMAEFTIRRDGSSNFGSEDKWANFPSVSVGWNLKNEQFMQDKLNWMTSFKLRASWGKNGNENIGAFNYVYLVDPGANYPLGNPNDFTSGIAPLYYANPNAKWEESEQLDIGFDSRYLNGALSFSFDWFKKKTNGMLMRMTVPQYTGALAPYANVGDMENSGVEMDVNYQFKVSDVHIKVGANASYLKNKLIQLGNDEGYANYDGSGVGTISRAQNGLPFPYFYGKKTAGVFQNQAQIDAYVNDRGEKLQPNAAPGDVIFVDINHDGVIDNSDRTKIGKGMPDWTFGFNFSVEYKGFDLTANMQATLGNDIYDATRRTTLTYINMPSYTLDRWHGEGTSNKYPRLSKDTNGNWDSSDLYVKNGSFLRMRTFQIGYTIPQVLLRKMHLQNLRIHATAENLFTITSYDGSDPEISSGGTSLGIDKGVYPQPRTFSIGANITF